MNVWYIAVCKQNTNFLETCIKSAAKFSVNAEGWLDKNVSNEALIAIPALFIALLVPIAFFLMERQGLYGFDKNVIIERIILAKITVPLAFLVSLSLIFNVKTLSVILTVVLFMMVMLVLVRVYKWTLSIEVLRHKTTYKQNMRMSFIRAIKSDTEKVDTWAIILNDESLSEKNQRGLIAEFLVASKNLHDGDNLYPKTNLIGLMSQNIKKIDFTDIRSYEDLIAYSIEYFPEVRDVRTKRKQSDTKNAELRYPPYSQRELALNLLKIALDKKISDILSYIYFAAIKKYSTKKDVNEPGFIRDFLPAYIHIVKSNESYEPSELWQELSDWIVTKSLLSNKDTWDKASNLLNAYMESVGREARLGIELTNHEINVIDSVTQNMLPNINASLWFDIITFYTSGYGLNEGEDNIHAQIRNHISTGRQFGLFSGVSTSNWIDDEDSRMKFYKTEFDKQDEETIYILGLLFRWLCNPEETQKVLDQIKIMETEELFEDDSTEALRLESLKIRFEKIQSHTARMVIEQKREKARN